jgi:hypothetical protein
MTRIDVDGLRLRFEAALEAYRLHAARLIEQSKAGHQPPPQELVAEESALSELQRKRRELLGALGVSY